MQNAGWITSCLAGLVFAVAIAPADVALADKEVLSEAAAAAAASASVPSESQLDQASTPPAGPEGPTAPDIDALIGPDVPPREPGTPPSAVVAAGIEAAPAATASPGWPVPRRRPPGLQGPAKPLKGAALICDLIVKASAKYGVPQDFFARLLWKESRFDIKAISPVGAQGIAQFMPTTAQIRGLRDPWDPRQAIPASAHFLSDLNRRFGNYGLAAAAYNGGPNRVSRWLEGSLGQLPGETVDYVYSITYRPVEWFRDRKRQVERRPLEDGKDFMTACSRLPIIKTRALAVAPKRSGGTKQARARAPWGVQVAAGISRKAAQRALKRVRSRLGAVIGGRGAVIVRQGKGSVAAYSARIGAPNRSEARKLCARIRAAGAPCVVRRN